MSTCLQYIIIAQCSTVNALMIFSVRLLEFEILNADFRRSDIWCISAELSCVTKRSYSCVIRLIGGVKCAKEGPAPNSAKVMQHRQPYAPHVPVCKQQVQVRVGNSVGVPSIDIYISTSIQLAKFQLF
jgi:hypothetical protein